MRRERSGSIVLGISVPFNAAVSHDVFGSPGFSTIFGSIHISLGFGTATGAWAGGKIFDLTGSYTAAFWGALGLTCFSCVLLWVVAPRRPNPPPGRNDQCGMTNGQT